MRCQPGGLVADGISGDRTQPACRASGNEAFALWKIAATMNVALPTPRVEPMGTRPAGASRPRVQASGSIVGAAGLARRCRSQARFSSDRLVHQVAQAVLA